MVGTIIAVTENAPAGHLQDTGALKVLPLILTEVLSRMYRQTEIL
jgi:hypothetical protein